MQRMTSEPSAPSPYVLVIDDHPLVARGLAHFIQSSCPGLAVVPMTRWQEALNLVATIGEPSLLIADVWLGDGNSLVAMDSWRQTCPRTPWLAISGDDDPALEQRVSAAGAQGFVHKQAPPERFARAVEAVLGGGTWFASAAAAPDTHGLTPRQNEILTLLLRGLPNKRIASELGIAEATVKEHITAVLARLGVRTRVEAITALSARRQRSPDAGLGR
jgi:DNA-binding NarL/FixJ family response regulator